jgi:hypothetical protein
MKEAGPGKPAGDGVITVEEFKKGLDKFKSGLTEDEIAELLKVIAKANLIPCTRRTI